MANQILSLDIDCAPLRAASHRAAFASYAWRDGVGVIDGGISRILSIFWRGSGLGDTAGPTCKADADDGEWSILSGVTVRWVHGRPFRMTSGEMSGDWIYHPGTLANGGEEFATCA